MVIVSPVSPSYHIYKIYNPLNIPSRFPPKTAAGRTHVGWTAIMRQISLVVSYCVTQTSWYNVNYEH